MTEEKDLPENEDPPDDAPEDDAPGDEDPPEDKGKGKADPELAKAIARRDKALADKRAALEKVRELEEKLNPGKDDPVAQANRRLIAAEARTVLTGKGITEKADQRAVMDFLALDTVQVDSNGEVDTDAIEERVDSLARVFGKLGTRSGSRGGPRVDTRDRGGDKGKPEDAATRRRREMLA